MSDVRIKLAELKSELADVSNQIKVLRDMAQKDEVPYEYFHNAVSPLFEKKFALEDDIKVLKDFYEEKYAEFAVYCGYSDVYPYEIVKRVSDKCIEVREMDAEIDKSVKLEWDVGGFGGHCKNPRDQKWFYSSNENNNVIRIRLGKKGWKDKNGRQFKLKLEPYKYYDYNF